MGGPTESIFSKAFFPIGIAATAFGSVGVTNQYMRRPFFSGIQRHIAFGILGGLFGLWMNDFAIKKYSKRDAIIRHYIELHPEDFKEERRQYKEVFAAWYPQR